MKRIADQKSWVAEAGLKKQHYMFGTMIEIPRAAKSLLTKSWPSSLNSSSFGTNDLHADHHGVSRVTTIQEVLEGI